MTANCPPGLGESQISVSRLAIGKPRSVPSHTPLKCPNTKKFPIKYSTVVLKGNDRQKLKGLELTEGT